MEQHWKALKALKDIWSQSPTFLSAFANSICTVCMSDVWYMAKFGNLSVRINMSIVDIMHKKVKSNAFSSAVYYNVNE